MMKRKHLMTWIAGLAVGIGFGASNALAVDLYYAGADVGSTGYQIAIAQARIAKEVLNDVNITVEETGGGLTNLTLVNDHKEDFGSGPADGAQEAYTGVGRFEGNALRNIRGWMVGFERREHMVVLADSPIKTWSDLKGKRIAVSTKGSGSNLTAERILHVLGLWDSITPYYISYKDATAALQTGRIDAAYFGTGIPIGALVELGISHPFRILEVTPEEAKTISDAYPAYRPGIIPAGTYPGIDKDIHTISVYNIDWVNKDVPDDIVYELTKAIWENHDKMVEAHASQKGNDVAMVPEALVPALPLHPGAERYYLEIGVIK